MVTKRKGLSVGDCTFGFLVEIPENFRKFKKIQQFIGRIVVRIELVRYTAPPPPQGMLYGEQILVHMDDF